MRAMGKMGVKVEIGNGEVRSKSRLGKHWSCPGGGGGDWSGP